jgi:hypothetical protein
MSHRLIPAVLFASLAAGCGAAPAAPAPEPGVPVPLAPAANAILPNGCFDFSREKAWDFDWTDVPGASTYHLLVESVTASNALIDRQDITTSSYRYLSTGWTGSLSGWRWRVRARVGGSFGDWSPTMTFDVEPPNLGCE